MKKIPTAGTGQTILICKHGEDPAQSGVLRICENTLSPPRHQPTRGRAALSLGRQSAFLSMKKNPTLNGEQYDSLSEPPNGERHIEAHRAREHGARAREHDAEHDAEEGVVDREPQDLFRV